MKIGRSILAFLIICLLLGGSISVVAAQSDASFDLAITGVESDPLVTSIGENTSFFITYENLSPNAIDTTATLDLVLTVKEGSTKEILTQCRHPIDLSNISASNMLQKMAVPNCQVVFNTPDTHIVQAEFVASGEPLPEGSFYSIANDINPGNNGSVISLIPAAEVSYDALPADLARIFAGLAIFFAVMALIAGGTEVVIDSLKVAIGLKRKVTSMEALERMEKYLPGELATLSVSSVTREQYQRMVQEMRSTIDLTLTGATTIATIREQVAKGEFGDIYRQAESYIPEHGAMSQQNVYNFQKYLQSFVSKSLNSLENKLMVSNQSVRPLRDLLAQEISIFDGQNPDTFLQSLFEKMQDSHFWSQQITSGWLSEQENTLFERSSNAVLSLYDADVGPLLLSVGFVPEAVDYVRREMASRLRIVETGVSQATDTFINSVRNVLDGVEYRRFETQSPSRKAWRILRSWRGGVFPPTGVHRIFAPAFFFALLAVLATWQAQLLSRNFITEIVEQAIPAIKPFPLLSWVLFYFIIFILLLFILHIIRKTRSVANKPTFIGLYGVVALSLLVSALLVGLLWLLQPESSNRVTGLLTFFNFSQPWWIWLTVGGVSLFLLLLLTGQLGKHVYDRQVRAAVSDGVLASDQHKLDNATILLRVETFGNLLRHGFDVALVDPDSFDQAKTVTSYEEMSTLSNAPDFSFEADTTAQFIMSRSDQQRDEETSRLRLLRVISISVGLVLAYVLQIDVLDLLGEAFPGILDNLNVVIVSGETLHTWRSWFPIEKTVTVGIVLTAFAASAGSAFWHDRLDKLQASKKGAQAAAQLLSQASQVVDSTRSDR